MVSGEWYYGKHLRSDLCDVEPGSAGAAIVGLGLLLVLLNLLASVLGRRGARAGADPWGAQTLEWATTSPPPPHNFDALPEIRSDAPLLDLEIGRPSAAAAEPQEA